MVQRIEHIFEDEIEKKWCGKCKTFKICKGDSSKFGKGGKKCWDGLRPTCKDCLAEHNAQHKEEKHAYNAEYWKKTKDSQSERRKEWGEQNKEYIAAKNKEWREVNGKEYDKKEWQKRKLDPHHRDYQRDYARTWCKKQRAENPEYKLKHNVSRRIRELLHDVGQDKKSKTCNYIGCTIEYFKSHIEKQFDDKMTWENQGEWHLDHILPCNAFDLTNSFEIQACFNYRNYQPLWGPDNIRKKDHYNPRDKEEYLRVFAEIMNENK